MEHAWRRGEVFKGFWLGEPDGKRPLGRHRRRWGDNIKMYLRESGMNGANWNRPAQDDVQWRVSVNTVMNRRVP